EVVINGRGRPGCNETSNAIEKGWIKVEKVKDKLAVQSLREHIGEGEAEAIILAKEMDADIILLDDRKPRKTAKFLGLKVTGTIGLLLLAIEHNIPIDIKKEIDTLIANGFRISKDLYEKYCL
ncbi:MAG: DUF3368 domain-containing protein, partial [Methanosarcinales archaeon]